MAILSSLCASTEWYARLYGAVRWNHEIERRESMGALRKRVEKRPVSLVVVDLNHPDVRTDPESLRRLRTDHSQVHFVLVEPVEPEPFTLFRVGGLKLGRVSVISALATKRNWEAHIRRALRGSAPVLLRTRLGAAVEERYHRVLDKAVDSVGREWGRDDLARVFCRSPRTFSKEILKAGLPRPALLLSYARMVQAAFFLPERGRTIRKLGRAVDYTTSANFFHAFKARTGMTPEEALTRGAFDVVVEALLGEME